MPLFYHGAAAVVKMDFCLFGGIIGCIITHGKKVQKRCNIYYYVPLGNRYH